MMELTKSRSAPTTSHKHNHNRRSIITQKQQYHRRSTTIHSINPYNKNKNNNRRGSAVHMHKFVIHQFLPIILKLSLLSGFCAISTFCLGFILWTYYPTLSSVIDSTINGFCVYLAFAFARPMYKIFCLPLISCSKCKEIRNIIESQQNNPKQKKSVPPDIY